MKTPLTFAKIVATPSLSSWSQAYNAGNLAAIASLVQKPLENAGEQNPIESELSLQTLGKDLLNTLEAEYFTLETKNLSTIKKAIAATCEKVGEGVKLSLSVSVIIENILYLFQYGAGKILMKREEKLGTLLEQQEENKLTGASGFIQNGDVVILETPQFANIVTTDVLLPCLEEEKLSEMAEILSPVIHEKQDGGAAALAFSYTEENAAVSHEKDEEIAPFISEEEISSVPEPQSHIHEDESEHTHPHKHQQNEQEEQSQEEESEHMAVMHEPPKRKSFPRLPVSHTRRIFFTIVVIIVLVLLGSIFFSLKRQQDAKVKQLFAQTVVPAQKQYDEGQSLLELNKNVARDDFQGAKNTLAPAIGKFPKGSVQEKQVNDLEQKIDAALTVASAVNTTDAKQVDSKTSDILAALIKHTDSNYAAIDDKNVYSANDTGIIAASKTTGKETMVIKNNTDWKTIGGLSAYLGNIYLLDKSDGILKYVPSGGTFSKSGYFPGTAPDLSKAVDIAIDGSIWILSSDGLISKYTRGKQDSFTLKGLDKPFTNPSRIFTTVDEDNVYVLDNGNKRIVVLDKNGNYIAQYQANVLTNAQAMDVVEKNKQIFVLSGSKVYEVDLK